MYPRITTNTQYCIKHKMCEKRKLLVQKYIEENKMDDPDRKYSIHDARNFAGECNDMCPEYERYEREFQNGLMEFEKVRHTLVQVNVSLH